MNFSEFKNNKAQQPLPKSLVPHEAEIAHFTTLCQKACDQILTLIALGLDVSITHPAHPYYSQSIKHINGAGRSPQTGSQPATTPPTGARKASSDCSITHQSNHPTPQTSTTTSTCEPARIAITGASRFSFNGTDRLGWRF